MLREKATDDNFADVERQLIALAHKCWLKNQGDLEEYKAVAREAFVVAFESFEKKQSALITWITNKVSWALDDYVRFNRRRSNRLRFVESLALECDQIASPEAPDYESLSSLADRLNADARRVVSLALVLEQPDDKPHQVRMRLKEYLKWSGWGDRKINKVFATIRQSL